MAVNLGNLIVNLKLDSSNMDKNLLKSQRKLNKFTQNITDIGKNMQSLGLKMTAFVSLPIALVGIEAVKASAEMEAMTTSFEALLGNKADAEDFVSVISQFSAETPFQIQDIGKASKILLAFGRSAQEVEEDLKNIGDVSAALNVPIAEVAKTFGKVFGKGIIQTEELWQLVERGIPIFEELEAITGKTSQELLDMAEKRQLSSELLVQAFQRMAGEGGRFQDFMLKMSKTMVGIWSNFKDNMFLMLVQFGDMIVETIKLKKIMNGLINTLKSVAKGFKSMSAPVRTIIVLALIAVASIGPLIFLLGTLVVAIGGVSAALLAMQIVILPLLANPLTLVILAAIAGLVVMAGMLTLVAGLFVDAFGEGNTFFEKLNNLALGSSKVFAEWGLGLANVFEKVVVGLKIIGALLEFQFKTISSTMKLIGDLAFNLDPKQAGEDYIERSKKNKKNLQDTITRAIIGDFFERNLKGDPKKKPKKKPKPIPVVDDPVKKFAEIIKAGSVKDFQIRNKLMDVEKTTETKNQEANETTAKNTKKMADEQKRTNTMLSKSISVTVGIP